MATVKSIGYVGEVDRIWNALLKLVYDSGYTVIRTDATAKQVIFKVASGTVMVLGQIITVSVSAMGESETLISIQAETDGGGPDPFNLGGRPQRKIIAFFIEELGKSFATVASCPTTKAPNASGCAVMALVFMGFGISAYAAGARLTAG